MIIKSVEQVVRVPPIPPAMIAAAGPAGPPAFSVPIPYAPGINAVAAYPATCVQYLGSMYVCIEDHVTTTSFQPNKWVLAASRGDPGEDSNILTINGEGPDGAGNVQLNVGDIPGAEATAQKNQPNGYAGLDLSGKLTTAVIPDAILGTIYKGVWNASTNTPAIPAAATGNKANFYIVSVAGTTNISGITSWAIGDWIVSDGTRWDKIVAQDAVVSVAGRQGVVTLTAADIAAGNYPSGNFDYTAGQVLVPTQTPGNSTTRAASTAFVQATVAASALVTSTTGDARDGVNDAKALTPYDHKRSHQPAFFSTLSAVGVSPGSWTAMTGAESFDSDNAYNGFSFQPGATNAGFYLISLWISMPTAGGERGIGLYINGALSGYQQTTQGGLGTLTVIMSGMWIVPISGTDYVQPAGFTDYSGGNLNGGNFSAVRIAAIS